MRRREFIKVIAGSAAAWPLVARAEHAGRVRLIGALMGYAENDQTAQSEFAAFRGALAKLGWTENSNVRIETRWGAADPDRIKALAKELVGLQPDAIFGQTTLVTSALARETKTIPIVFVNVSDPIGSGFAANLARPGGNITGFTNNDPGLGGKWMELLTEIAPRTARVALLLDPATAAPLQFYMPSIQAAASSFAIQVSVAPAHAVDEIEGVIAAQAREPGGGLIVMPASFNVANRDLIIALAARYGVPAIYFVRVFVESGGLISYADDRAEEFRQAANYLDRIFKGAKPTDLPVQAPTKFELAINLKTAKALGLTVSREMRLRADELIE